MSECVTVKVGGTVMLVMRGGPTLTLDGVTFEFSQRFGPMGVGTRGQEKALPGVTHRWWKALHWWLEQGTRVADGVCLYVEPTLPVERRVHIIGNHWLVVPDHWTQEQIDAEITHLLTLAHRRSERRPRPARCGLSPAPGGLDGRQR